KARACVIARKTRRLEKDAQQSKSYRIFGFRPEITSGGVQSAQSFGVGGEFLEQILDIGRQLGEAPRPGSIRQLEVDPQVLQHLDQVALTGTEEATDPNAGLLALVQMAEVSGQNAAQASGVLAV